LEKLSFHSPPGSKGWCLDQVESEYRDLADLAADVAWTMSILMELGYLFRRFLFFGVKTGAQALVSNPVIHARSHIELDVHYIKDQVLQIKLLLPMFPR